MTMMQENEDSMKSEQAAEKTAQNVLSAAQKEAAAVLRESFLRAIEELHGKSCNILTCENSSLTATFSGLNLDGSEILLQNLKTPSNDIVPSALVRSPDILAIQFDKTLNLP